MIAPVKKHIVTSPYGWRKNPFDKSKSQFHGGIDWISGDGDRSVLSISDSTVTYDMDDYEEAKKFMKGHTGGNMIITENYLLDKKIYIAYLHLEENFVKKGQKIKEGELIGIYGDVGISAGAHVHTYFYNKKWVKIDPTPFFKFHGIDL